MTYVSRRARIIVPRWPNESDTDFLFRTRRRCDGRLKRLSSCHDLRAWINDNCIKNEYLKDLMSDGEFTVTPPLKLYGRFIPVPLLFKLLQNTKPVDGEEHSKEFAAGMDKSEGDLTGKSIHKSRSKSSYDKDTAERQSAYDADTLSRTTIDDKDTPGRQSSLTPAKGTSGNPGDESTNDTVTPKRKVTYDEFNPGDESTNDTVTPKRKVTYDEFNPGDQSNYDTPRSKVYGEGNAWDQSICDPDTPEWGTDTKPMKDEGQDGFSRRASSSGYPEKFSKNSKCSSEDISDKKPGDRSSSQTSMARVLREKNIMEKNLFRFTCLLSYALGKLEKVDNIIQVANEESEELRKEEIQEAFRKSKMSCTCLKDPNNDYQHVPDPSLQVLTKGPRADLKKFRDSAKCNELLRYISCLREKLKKNQESRQRINKQLFLTQRRAESSTSAQMNDIFCRRDQPQIKKLQKKLECLVSERGKFLSDMCQALTCLNNLRKSNSSRTSFRRNSKSELFCKSFSDLPRDPCLCGCMTYESSDTERARCSDSLSSEDGRRFSSPCEDKNNYDCLSDENADFEQDYLHGEEFGSAAGERVSASKEYKHLPANGEFQKDQQREKEGSKNKLGAVYPQIPFSSFEECLSSEHRLANRGILKSCKTNRPCTSPTTKRERQEVWIDSFCFPSRRNSSETPGRRVKSETTMKEIEKTLRNYEQRLKDMDGLEFKVEEWKRKLLNAYRMRRSMSKKEALVKKELESERERSSKEIDGLFSENCELKRQVRELMDKFKEQTKKIQNLKTSVMRTKDLECEAEELKKELSEYRNSYEHQRKCISKWESVVAVQRKEIENLMNHIRKLTTERMKEQRVGGFQDRRHAQRSRSFSPVAVMDCQNFVRPQAYDLQASEEDNGSCCCQEFRQSESRRAQLKYFDVNCYASVNGGVDWCN